jgi:hypothetical protein
MDHQLVLRISRSDGEDNAFVLLNITKTGSSAQDLKLVATEGESVFIASS